MKLRKKISLLCLIALFSSCSRTAEKTPLKDAELITGPKSKDSQLTLVPPSMENVRAAYRWKSQTSTAEYFRAIESIHELAKETKSEELRTLAKKMYQAFYRESSAYTKTTFAHGLYIDAVLGEGELEVRSQLKTISAELRRSMKALQQLLGRSEKDFPWPSNLENFPSTILVIDAYVGWLINHIPELGLEHNLERSIRSATTSEYEKIRPKALAAFQAMDSANSLARALYVLDASIKEFRIKPAGEQAEQIQQARQLAADLQAMQSSQNALTVIVSVWRMVPKNLREPMFKQAAPEFYDFLNGKSESDLDCLAATLCLNPILQLAKTTIILPKISSYGVENIRQQIDTAAKDYMLSTLLQAACELLPQMPSFVNTMLTSVSQQYLSLIAKVQKDIEGYAYPFLEKWDSANIGTSLKGVESAKISLDFTNGNKIKIIPQSTDGNTFYTSAETLGLSLSLAQEFNKNQKAALIEPIMKLLAIGGFRQYGSGKTFPGFNYAMDGKPNELFDIKSLLQGSTSFFVPDLVPVNRAFTMDRKTVAANANVSSQAELLRGISRQLRFHRDWEKNSFDEVLGNVAVEDILTEIPRGAINYSFFPKDVVFALAMGNAAGILQNIIRPLSTAFLLLPEGELLWGDRYKEIGEGKVSTIAGLVAIKNGKRTNLVHTTDIARYILALDEFLQATEGIENTKAAPLLEKTEDGRTVLEQLIEARRYLKLFMLGLTNYLISIAQDKTDGGVYSTYVLDGTQLSHTGGKTLQDQTLSIRALLASARQLEIPLYRWTALDIYYFMNKNLWDQKTQFYASSAEEQKNPLTIWETMQAMQELIPFMHRDSRVQAEKILTPWLEGLESL